VGDENGTGAPPSAGRGRLGVVIVGPVPPPYHGVAVHTELVLQSSAFRAGCHVVHVDTTDPRPMGNAGHLDFANVVLAGRHLLQLIRAVRRHRPRVVYVQVSQNGLGYLRDVALMGVVKAFRCRVATHLHGSAFRSFYEGAGRPIRWLVRTSMRWVDGAAVLSDRLRTQYEGLVPADRVTVVPVGARDPLTGQSRRACPSSEKPRTLGYLGLLCEAKGLLDLLEAFAQVSGTGAGPYRLVLAGEWVSDAERENAEKTIARLGLGGAVELRGPVADEAKRSFFGDLDLFVFPGRQPEGLPLVILEAMAARLPVVSTDVGAIPDAMREGKTGYLVPPGNVRRLSEAIREVLERQDRGSTMGGAGRARYEERFTVEQGVKALQDFLATVAER